MFKKQQNIRDYSCDKLLPEAASGTVTQIVVYTLNFKINFKHYKICEK